MKKKSMKLNKFRPVARVSQQVLPDPMYNVL